MRFRFYSSAPPSYSAAYIAHRDRVVADGGAIASASACQQALDLLASPAGAGLVLEQWLDTRFGVQASPQLRWYSIMGATADAGGTGYGRPLLGNDSLLGGRPIWSKGAFAGHTDAVSASESYMYGMRFILTGPATGYLFGDAYRPLYLADTQLGIPGGQVDFPLLTKGAYQWVFWGVDRQQGKFVVLDEQGTELGSTASAYPIGALNFGIGGDKGSAGNCGPEFRVTSFFRCRTWLTPAQRAAIQAI